MALNKYGSSSKAIPSGKTEFDILKASHKYVRNLHSAFVVADGSSADFFMKRTNNQQHSHGRSGSHINTTPTCTASTLSAT